MATMQTLLDDLNDRLADTTNSSDAGEPVKMRWINHGVRAMWPLIYRTVQDATLALVDNQYEYSIPAAVGDESEIFRIEVESLALAGRFLELDNFDIVPTITGRVIQLKGGLPSLVGANLRVTAAVPLRVMATTATTFDGRAVHEELPVLYAMGLACSRRHENRLGYTRYSTTAAANGVDIGEVMQSAAFWFEQFERTLVRMSMPLPPSVG